MLPFSSRIVPITIIFLGACSGEPTQPIAAAPTNVAGVPAAPAETAGGPSSASSAASGSGSGGASSGSGGAPLAAGNASAGSSGGVSPPADEFAGPFANPAGSFTNWSSAGSFDSNNDFFKGFGNGRGCVSCHRPKDGFGITPKTIQDLFSKCGLDADTQPGASVEADPTACAIFRPNDGATSPSADVSTPAARRVAYALLLSRGLIRITFPVPPEANRQYDVVDAFDPYGVGTTSKISVFRRPLPATNLAFAKSVMWDMRETSSASLRAPFTPDVTNAPPLDVQLKQQAINATLGHAEAMMSGLSDAQADSIVQFEMSLFSAQTQLNEAGDLSSDGALGGTVALSKQTVTPLCGNLITYTNNPQYPQCQQYRFDPIVFTIFGAWAELQGSDAQSQMRASIARGQVLFNTRKTFSPDKRDQQFYDHSGDNKNMTCSTCHSDFNAGGASVPVGFANVAVGSGPSIVNSPNPQVDFLDPELPRYTLRCNARGMASFNNSGGLSGCHDGSEPGIARDEITLNDPGRGVVTGSWPTVGAFKATTLRNLSSHAPYFHDGSAATLTDVVEHYKKSLGFELTDAETGDLVNFLSAL
jgi:cytochrome c peroxidase